MLTRIKSRRSIARSLIAVSLFAVVVSLFMGCQSADPTPTPVPPTATSAPVATATTAPEPEAPTSTEVTKIGTLLDATGDLATYGPPLQIAADLAVELVNEAGGVNGGTLEVVHRDSGTSEQIATDAASALVNVEGVDAIIGSLSSGVTIAVAESVTIPGGAVLISPASTSPAISGMDDNDLLFRTAVSDALQGVVAATVANELGLTNVATLYINNAYGEGLTSVFAENFENLGGTVSAQVGIESGQATYLSELRQASEGGAEALMAIGYPESAGVFLREAVEGDFFEMYLFVDGTKSQEMFDALPSGAFDGNYGTAPGAPDTPSKQEFLDLYSSRTEGNPDALFISEAFDAAVVLALAIEHADSGDGDAIKNSMREVANAPGEQVGPGDIARALELIRAGEDVDYVGAAGDQDFDANGDVLNTIEVWRVADGQITSTGIFARPGDEIDLSSSGMMMMEEPSGEVVKIGTLLDVTGDLAVFGPPMQIAADLAVELVNEAGGVNGGALEVVHRDSGTSEQIATDAASALVNVEGVDAIIGSLSSGVTIAVAESVTIPGGALLVSPASSSPVIAGLIDDDRVFRTAVSDALQGVVAASLANEIGIQSVATLYINNAYGEGLTSVFKENFEKLGGTVSAEVGIESGQATYLSELLRASDSGAEALMAIGYPESAGVFLREAVEGDLFQQYLFVDGTKSQEMFDELPSGAFDGNYGTAPGTPDTPTRQAFLDLYSTRTDGNADSLFIGEAFDAAVLLALAIERADSTDPDDVKDSLRAVANAPGEKVGPGDIARALELVRSGTDIDYVGAAGDQDFDANGDVLNTIEIWQLKDGQIVSTDIFAKPGDEIDLASDAMMMMEEPSGETVKIGTLLDATGDLASYGPPLQIAADLAVELVNEAGGVNGGTLEVVHRDSGTSEQIATDAASALVNVEGVDAIIGSLSSGVTIAVAESVTIPGGAVLISPASTSPAISGMDDNDLLFRTAVSDALQGVIAATLANELGLTNVATLYINNAYGEGLTSVFAENFERLGGTVSAQVGIESGQATYLSELRQASRGGAEALMAIGYPQSAGVFLREAVEGDFFEMYLFVDGTKSQEMFDALPSGAFDGNYGTAPGAPDTPSKQEFLDLYSSRTEGNPDALFISEAFDAAVVLALAIEHADSADGDAIKNSMRVVANAPGEKVGPGDVARALALIRAGEDVDYVGAAGDQDFDANGDVLNTIEVWRVVDGQITSTGIFARPGDEIDLE